MGWFGWRGGGGGQKLYVEKSLCAFSVPGDFPGTSLTVDLKSNPEVPQNFPILPRSSSDHLRSNWAYSKVNPSLWEA